MALCGLTPLHWSQRKPEAHLRPILIQHWIHSWFHPHQSSGNWDSVHLCSPLGSSCWLHQWKSQGRQEGLVHMWRVSLQMWAGHTPNVQLWILCWRVSCPGSTQSHWWAKIIPPVRQFMLVELYLNDLDYYLLFLLYLWPSIQRVHPQSRMSSVRWSTHSTWNHSQTWKKLQTPRTIPYRNQESFQGFLLLHQKHCNGIQTTTRIRI